MISNRRIKHYVYFIESQKNFKIYVGSTSKNPEIRVKEHNNGTNEWTKNNRPFKLIYYEEYICQRDAINREKFYKTGFGKNIKYLIIKYIKSNNINSMIK